MDDQPRYEFGDYLLDIERYELRRGSELVPVEPQVFDVLAYLVQHHDRMVSKDELLEHVWPDKYISEATLSSRLMAARKAIGDDGKSQRFIRTIHGRGFRFVGQFARTVDPRPTRHTAAPTSELPGRHDELARLQQAWQGALEGRRQAVFVTGEGGIGKSALLMAFRESVSPRPAWSGAGQCVELSGSGEPYLPVLDALTHLRGATSADDDQIGELLQRHAPTWLAQLSGAPTNSSPAHMPTAGYVPNRERMVRELLEFLDALANIGPVLLTLDDLHWSDQSTLELLAAVARRPHPARLLMVATCTPGDARGDAVRQLKAELGVRGLCTEVALGRLGTEDIVAMASRWRHGLTLDPELARQLSRRCGGNPLFIRSVLNHLEARGALDDGGQRHTAELALALEEVPPELKDLLRLQHSRLDPFQRGLLEAAAIAAPSFSARFLSRLLDLPGDEEAVETACEELTERGPFLVRLPVERGAELPAYAFVHDLHREMVDTTMPRSRRSRLHLRAGTLLEADPLGSRAVSPAQLAHHFELGGEPGRAVPYRREAAVQAFGRSGYIECVSHLETAIRLLETGAVPDAPRHEMAIRAALAPALTSVRGFRDPEAERAWRRTLELARELGDRDTEESAILSLVALLEYRGRHRDAEELLKQHGDDLAQAGPLTRTPYHALLSCSAFHQGRFEASFEQGRLGLVGPVSPPGDPRWALFGEDPGNGCREWAALALWFLGRPDSAVQLVEEAVADAREPGRRYALASALVQAARIRQLRREPAQAEMFAREALEVASTHGFPYQHATALVLAGWAAAATGARDRGIEEMETGLQQHEQTGASMDRPYLLALLAERLHDAGLIDRAARVVAEALDEAGEDEFFYEAELIRLQAALGSSGEAAPLLSRAVQVARNQGALGLELRAAVAFARAEAREDNLRTLASIVASFAEGLDSVDMHEAAAVLAAAADAR